MFFNSGKHKTLKIETEEGYEVEGSLNHPVLTWTTDENGKPVYKWKTLDQIKVGDYVVVSRLNDIESDKDLLTEEEAVLLGSLVSEGYISDSRVGFNNTDEDFAHQFLIEYQIHDKDIIQDISSKGFSEKSGNKEIPYAVLQSSKKVQRAFLKALFEGDGSIYSGKGTVVISYSSKSKKLLKQQNFRLIISGYHNIKLFYEKIGFLGTKRKRL